MARQVILTFDCPQSRISYKVLYQGCAVVTLQDAFLFTDGRYFLHAEQQLDKYVSDYTRRMELR